MKQIFLILAPVLLCAMSVFSQNGNVPCPKITVTGGGEVMPGDAMLFKVVVEDMPDNAKIEYLWKVSAGQISKGNGTSEITVNTNGLENKSLTATVEIKGMPESCVNTASETGAVSGSACSGLPFDQLDEKELPNRKRGRLDSYLEALRSRPDSYPIITIEFAGKPTEKQINKRIKFIADWFVYRKENEFLKRAVFNIVEDSSEVTKFYFGYPKTKIEDLLYCNDCKIIKGTEIYEKFFARKSKARKK